MSLLMFQFFKELYFTCFTLFFRAGIYRWSLPTEIGKAVACVTLMEAINLLGIDSWIEMHIGERFHFDRWTIIIGFFALYLLNYYVLAIRGHGITFEREFNKLQKSKKILSVVSFVGLILATIAFFIWTVQAYHRFFHIIPKSGF